MGKMREKEDIIIQCPMCSHSKDVAKLIGQQYYCRNCCIEIALSKSYEMKVYRISEDGAVILLEHFSSEKARKNYSGRADLTKICTKCGAEKRATSEYFYKCEGGKYGVRSFCKECEKNHKKKAIPHENF